MVDSHCHIAGPEFAADLAEVIERAQLAGVTQTLVILAADDEPEIAQGSRVAAQWPAVRFSVGVHPHAAGRFATNPADAAKATEAVIASQPLTRALGEIGLDYHYDFAPRAVQQKVFREQIQLARQRRLPIVIHTREADDDTFRILSEEHAEDVGGVFHCFTGDRAMAGRVLDLGFHLSFAGIVTFPRANELKEVAKTVPLERLLLETDSPFLAPVPHRGKRNEPANVVRIAETIATLRGVDVATIGEAAGTNFARLFQPGYD
jgi:TatD DNase family protein